MSRRLEKRLSSADITAAESVFSNLSAERTFEEIHPLLREVPALADKLIDLPVKIKAIVLADLTHLREKYSLDSEDLIAEASRLSERAMISYVRRFEGFDGTESFEVPNKSYLRLELLRRIDEIVSRQDINEVNDVGFLYFDLNGLKAVNDLTGSHERGNEFLRRAVSVFQKGKTSEKLRKQGIEILLTSSGGDEFSIILQKQKGYDVDLNSAKEDGSILDWALSSYQTEIYELDCSDLIDFEDKNVKNKLHGIEIPSGFKFRGSIAGGSATLREALANFKYQPNLGYRRNLELLMGLSFNGSDSRMGENKKQLKAGLAASADPNERTLAAVYRVNRTSSDLEQSNTRLAEENEELKRQIERLRAEFK